jgi:hypothetical protein
VDVEVDNEKNPDGNNQRDEKNPCKRSFHSVVTPLTNPAIPELGWRNLLRNATPKKDTIRSGSTVPHPRRHRKAIYSHGPDEAPPACETIQCWMNFVSVRDEIRDDRQAL